MSNVSERSLFEISLIDLSGNIKVKRLAASSADRAIKDALIDGSTLIRCLPVRQKTSWLGHGIFRSLGKSQAFDTVSFSQDLATLMEAGVTIKEALQALTKKETSATKLAVLNALNISVSQGLSFSGALAQTKAFPELLVATVAASEQTGDLSTGLSRYARHQQSLRAVRDKVVGACVYPMLLMIVGSIVVAMLLGVVVPRFATLIDSTGRDLPTLSKLLMSWGKFVDAHPLAPATALALIAVGVAALVVQFKKQEFRRRWLERIPGVAKVVREFQHLQMYRTTAILTSRGIAIHKALVYSMEFLSPSDQQKLKTALLQMTQGVGVSAALGASGLSDVVAVSMINVAERTGAMPEMMDRIADFYERTLQRSIDIVSRLIEPILMIIFGVVIGGVVILMYLPIFDLASSLS